MNTVRNTAVDTDFFTHINHELKSDDVGAAMQLLFRTLRDARAERDSDAWRDSIRDVRASGLLPTLHLDPCTRRGYDKPRGYAGDAVLLDLIYRECGVRDTIERAPRLGREIYEFTTGAPAARAVRFRRDLLAQYIDAAAAGKHSPSVLSVACGHLREAALSPAFAEGRIGRFVAFDQDGDSLAEVARTYPGVEVVRGSVRRLLAFNMSLGEFDFIYAAGLLDYLDAPVAARLSRRLCDMLAPGGRLLLANFTPSVADAGYMEACMDWWLTYRTPAEMTALIDAADADIAWHRSFTDPDDNIVFLEVERSA